MDKKKVEDILINHGYKADRLVIGEKTIVFEKVYLREDKEAYIILDGSITEDKVNEYQKKILWFQNWTNSTILRYNINLLILYNNSTANKGEINQLISKLERDSHICRKIFLNLDRENCFDLLPFNKIQLSKVNIKHNELKEDIISILKTRRVYEELVKKDFDLNILKNELLSK